MRRLADKTALALVCCVLAFVPDAPDAADIFWLLTGITLSGALELYGLPRQVVRVVPQLLVVAAIWEPMRLACLLPLITYELASEPIVWLRLTWTIPAVRLLALGPYSPVMPLSVALALCAQLLSLRTANLASRTDELHDLRDRLQERVLELDASRRELEAARDEQAHSAALAERARISREIHDSVGHLLTRSILQVQALEVVHDAEPDVAAELAEVRETLSEALDVTRRSVHAMADEAFDLSFELHRLAQTSGIPHVTVTYDCEGTPPAELARTIAAVGREALTNAARHAHAENASIRVCEYPGLWQLVIANDGSMPELDPARDVADQLVVRGMGVRGMWERVLAQDGTFRMSCEDGRLTVFASFPRRGEQ